MLLLCQRAERGLVLVAVSSQLDQFVYVGAQVLPIKKTDSIAAMMPVHQFEAKDYLLMATQEGLIKKTPLSQFSDVRSNGILAMKLKVAPPPSSPNPPHSCWPVQTSQ